MTRILTIIALLFATPVAAEYDGNRYCRMFSYWGIDLVREFRQKINAGNCDIIELNEGRPPVLAKKYCNFEHSILYSEYEDDSYSPKERSKTMCKPVTK